MECHVKGLLQVLDNKLFIMQKSDKWKKFSKEVGRILLMGEGRFVDRNMYAKEQKDHTLYVFAVNIPKDL